MTFTHDVKGIILTANPTFAQFFGYNLSAIIGKNIRQFIIPKYKPKFSLYLKNIWKKGSDRGIMFVRTKSGEQKILEYHNTLKTSGVRQPIVRGMAHDITALKNFENALKESEGNWRALAENAPDIIMQVDRKGVIHYINRMLEGFKLEGVLGSTVYDFTPLDYHPLMKQSLRQVFRTAKPRSVEVVGPTAEGEDRWYSTRIGPLMRNDKVVSTIWITTDITETKQAEKHLLASVALAEETAKLKDEFLANVSHEIRTPMNGIIGMTDLLLQTPLGEKQKDFALTIKESSNILIRIINDLLDLSKIGAKKVKLKKENFIIHHTLESIIQTFESEALQKDIRLTCQISKSVPYLIESDELKLKQILNNLISNAIKYTQKGKVVVKLDAKLSEELKDKPTAELTVRVEDTGIGIALNDQDKLFEKFSQIDSSISRRHAGTGLGLAICKELVTFMNGEIGLESKVRKGSTFWFRLNVRIPAKNNLLQDIAVYTSGADKQQKEQLMDLFKRWDFKSQFIASKRRSKLKLKFDSKHSYLLLFNNGLENGSWNLKADRIKKMVSGLKVILVGDKGIALNIVNGTKLDLLIQNGFNSTQFLAFIFTDLLGSGYLKGDIANLLLDVPKQKISASILLIEDNPINQKVTREMLVSQGITVKVAKNGKTGIRYANKYTYDMILLDIQMPDMDGTEVLQLRKSKKNKNIPIVILTANALESEKDKFKKLGADYYLTKPIDLKTISNTIAQLLSGVSVPVKQIKERTRTKQIKSQNGKIINKKLFDFVKQLLGEEFEDVLKNYVKTAQKQIKQAAFFLEQKDHVKLKKVIHDLKSTSSYLGVVHMASLAQKVEIAIENDDQNDLKRKITSLPDEFDHIIGMLTKYPVS